MNGIDFITAQLRIARSDRPLAQRVTAADLVTQIAKPDDLNRVDRRMVAALRELGRKRGLLGRVKVHVSEPAGVSPTVGLNTEGPIQDTLAGNGSGAVTGVVGGDTGAGNATVE